MNGQTTGSLEIGNKVNLLKPINEIQGIRGLGIEVNSLKGDGGDCLDSFSVKVFDHDNNDVVALAKLNHAVESRGDHLILVQPRAPKQEVESGLQIDDVKFYIEYN